MDTAKGIGIIVDNPEFEDVVSLEGGVADTKKHGRILGNVATPHLNTADFRLSANRLSTPGTPRWASSTRASCGACR